MTKLSKQLSSLNPKSHGRLLGFGTSPENDWKVIVISSITLAVFLVLLGAYLFIGVDKGDIFTIEPEQEGVVRVPSVDALESFTTYYKDKEVEFNRLINSTPVGTDPSI